MLVPDTDSQSSSHRWWRYAAWAIIVVVSALGLFTVGDYGMSWDEPFRFRGGDTKLAYYEALVRGQELPEMSDTYPGLFDLPLALFRKYGPQLGSPSEQGHAWSLVFGLVGLFATWRFGALLGGERMGFWALLLLVTMPRYYGHMFFNPKDIPFAATYMLGLWALATVLKQLPTYGSWRAVALVGLTAGLAISSRIAGLLLLFYFAFMIFGFLLVKHVQGYLSRKSIDVKELLNDLLQWALRGALAGVIAYLLLMIFWPAGHGNPVARLGGAVDGAQSYGWNGLVLMDGMFWQAQDLPVYYMIYWLLRAVPEHIHLLLAAGSMLAALSVWSCAKSRAIPEPSVVWPHLLAVFACLFPFGYMLVKQPVLYDGLRHFLFLLPTLTLLAALALETVVRALSDTRYRIAAKVLPVGVATLVCIVILEMVSLHPYQYIYFNQASGGLPEAFNRDETDYWGISHRETAVWMNSNITEGESAIPGKHKVYMGYTPWMLEADLDDRFEITHNLEDADYLVAITRLNLHVTAAEHGELLHVVERQGVPLSFIFEVQQKKE